MDGVLPVLNMEGRYEGEVYVLIPSCLWNRNDVGMCREERIIWPTLRQDEGRAQRTASRG